MVLRTVGFLMWAGWARFLGLKFERGVHRCSFSMDFRAGIGARLALIVLILYNHIIVRGLKNQSLTNFAHRPCHFLATDGNNDTREIIGLELHKPW